MKISIITSCYNRVSTIRGSIESVLAQDYADIEYIIVDGASTDGSVDVIRDAVKGHEDTQPGRGFAMLPGAVYQIGAAQTVEGG